MAELSASKTVPAGYYGINSRIYSSGGTLKASSGYFYSDSADKGMSIVGPYYNATGVFYSKCAVKLFNGDGYNTVNSYQSPNMNWTKQTSDGSVMSSADISAKYEIIDSQYSVNENGQTYGSDMLCESLGEEPDLIAAENGEGIFGYVYSNDLEDGVSTPEEALKWIETHSDNYTIPLYESDGETVIGEFEISVEDITLIVN